MGKKIIQKETIGFSEVASEFIPVWIKLPDVDKKQE